MARDVAKELVQLLTTDLKIDTSAVNLETPLFEGGLEFDSFAVVELVTKFEGHFGFQLNDEDFAPESFKDIGTLAGVIEKYLAADAK